MSKTKFIYEQAIRVEDKARSTPPVSRYNRVDGFMTIGSIGTQNIDYYIRNYLTKLFFETFDVISTDSY